MQGKRDASALGTEREFLALVNAEARNSCARGKDDWTSCASRQHGCAVLQTTCVKHRLVGGKKRLALADLNQFRGLRRREFFTLTVPLHERIHLVVQTHEVVQTKIHAKLTGERIEDQSIGL